MRYGGLNHELLPDQSSSMKWIHLFIGPFFACLLAFVFVFFLVWRGPTCLNQTNGLPNP